MRRLCSGLVLTLLTTLVSCDGEIPDLKGPGKKPNVIFILADDLGYGDLQCYGNPYLDTPVLNELAANGIRCTDHYSPSPLCAPARAAFLTGRYNHRTGAIDVSSNRGVDRMALSEKTFGDYFKSAGYTTALIGKWHTGLYCNDYLPHNRGFDLFFGFPNGGQDYWNWNLMRDEVYETHDGRYMTDVFNDEAVRFIRKNKDQPFALFLAHHAPHVPLQAPDHLIEKYRKRLKGRYSDEVAIIYAMIEAMDTGLGIVFAELEKLGLDEETIIVFTSDNGAYLGGVQNRYHGSFAGNKGYVLEEGIRVPAIVSWPGKLPAGKILSVPIHGCDWLPTLFSLTACDPPAGAKALDGVNLMPLLGGKGTAPALDRYLPFQKNRYTPVAHSDAAIRKGKWKLYWPGEAVTMKKDLARDNSSYERGIDHRHWEMPLDPELPSFEGIETEDPELYDLVCDPAERYNLAAEYPEIVRELSREYDAWFEEVFAEWKTSNAEVLRYDSVYWISREAPDPRELFKDYWHWDQAPASTDPKKDDPLEVFMGYWK